MRRRWIGVIAGLAALAGFIYALPARPAPLECPDRKGALVIVDTKTRTLALCDGGQMMESFGIRLGKHGTGKTREGDGKTPLGRYSLGAPIHSGNFGIFIPIGYPTTEQRKLGYTGSTVGVHGPGRNVRWLGRLINAFDLSDGCVGLATDAEMERVAEFVTKRGAREIALR